MYPMIEMEHPASAKPARCFNLSDTKAMLKVLTEDAMKIGIINAWIFLALYSGLRTLMIVGENKVME